MESVLYQKSGNPNGLYIAIPAFAFGVQSPDSVIQSELRSLGRGDAPCDPVGDWAPRGVQICVSWDDSEIDC